MYVCKRFGIDSGRDHQRRVRMSRLVQRDPVQLRPRPDSLSLTFGIIIEGIVVTILFVVVLFLVSPDLAREILSYTR
jgi:hypothetical protein